MARRARPLRGALDGRAFAPLREGRDHLPRCARGDHGRDVAGPAARVSDEPGAGLVGLVEARADAVAEASLAVGCHGRGVLVPAIGLVRARPIPGKHLQDEISVDPCVSLCPAVDHAAGVGRVGVDEHDEPASDTKVRRIVAVVIAQVREIGAELAHAGIRGAFRLVVDGPSGRRTGSGREDLRHASVGGTALAPPGRDPDIDLRVTERRKMRCKRRARARVVVAQRRVVLRERVHALLVPGFREPRVVEGCSNRKTRLWVGAAGQRRRWSRGRSRRWRGGWRWRWRGGW